MSHHDPAALTTTGAMYEFPARSVTCQTSPDAFHRDDTCRRVDLATAGTETARIPTMQCGNVDLTGAGLEQPPGDPVRADHLGPIDDLIGRQNPDVGHELGDRGMHRVEIVEVAVWCDPDQRERFQQRPSESIRWVLHEGPARRREQPDRASAVALEERGNRSAGRVERERCFHLQQPDRAVCGQLVADRRAGDAAPDDEHIVGTHQRSLPSPDRRARLDR